MKLLPLNAHAPLEAWRRYPGARLALQCAACAWEKTYSPEKIAQRLRVLRRGGPETPISSVALSVQWPCPACHRLRWRTVLVAPDARPSARAASPPPS